MDGIGQAELNAALWVAFMVIGSRILPPKFGSAIVAGGPRWRSVTSMITQLIVLPWCFCTAAHHVGERTFIYIFALYMLLDFVLVKLDTLLIAHHIFCLIGHVLVVAVLPQAMPVYFAGVVMLELGSGAMNQFALWPDRRWRAVLYAVGMTSSNAAALFMTWTWASMDIPMAPKMLNSSITLVMVFMRQKSCYKYITKGPYAAH